MYMTHSVVYVSAMCMCRETNVSMYLCQMLMSWITLKWTHTLVSYKFVRTQTIGPYFFLYFLVWSTIVYSMIIIAIQPEAKSNKFKQREI